VKFKIDENLLVVVKDLLVAHGHDAHTVIEERLAPYWFMWMTLAGGKPLKLVEDAQV